MIPPASRRKAPVRCWLLKSEPTNYSIDDFQTARRDLWDGVRNYQARNLMRDEMQLGDKFFFYHSNCAEPAIVGMGKVIGKARPDPTQFDPDERYYDPKSAPGNPRWLCVEVGFVSKAKRPYPLAAMRQEPRLVGMPLFARGNRLSVQPVTEEHWRFICTQL